MVAVTVPSQHMTPVGEPVLLGAGWWELLLKVEWPPDNGDGTRFCHTKLSDGWPLHSEAINADVLNQLSEGKQMLRAHCEGPTAVRIEVWHDAGLELDAQVELVTSRSSRP